MSLFDELAKDSEEYLKNWEAGNNGENNEDMQQKDDLEKKMTEKQEEATKNLTKTTDAAEVKNVKKENKDSAGTGTDAGSTRRNCSRTYHKADRTERARAGS